MPQNARFQPIFGGDYHEGRRAGGEGVENARKLGGSSVVLALMASVCLVALVMASTRGISPSGAPRSRAHQATAAPAPVGTRTVSTTTQIPSWDNAPAIQVAGNQIVDQSGHVVRLLGVDATGTEDACVQGKGFGWGNLDQTEATSIAAWHANAVRVPLNEDCWLGINGVSPRYSGAAYQAKIMSWVQALNGAGLVAILDLHWSAPGTHKANQQWPMADADHSIVFWRQVASSFKADPSVIFDLFNEPYLGRIHPTAFDWKCWLSGCTTTTRLCATALTPACPVVTYQMAGMQQMLDAVRSTGANQPVMAGGLNWAGDPCGIHDYGKLSSCAWLKYEPTDPDHQIIDSFHTYNWTACTTVSCWNASVAPVARDVPVVTGELGEKDCSANYIDQYMSWADENGVSYLAWAWQPSAGKVALGCGGSNTYLLSSWLGSPSTSAPAGAAYAQHLAQLAMVSR